MRKPVNGLSGSNTVSRCPISSTRLPLPLPWWIAIKCPARPLSGMGLKFTWKPSASEFRAQHVCHRCHSRGVEGATVLRHHLFEQGGAAGLAGVGAADAQLGGRKRGTGGCGKGNTQQQRAGNGGKMGHGRL